MVIAPPQGNGVAPGAPGVTPTWSPGPKDAVTTALGVSRVWATVGHGIVNEVYWPSAGDPQVRDLGFIVAGNGFWQEVKLLPGPGITTPAPAVPIPTVVHAASAWTLTIELVPDPDRDVLLIRWQLQGAGVTLYPLLAPHLEVHSDTDPVNQGTVGADNQGWVTQDNTLMAWRDGVALCLAGTPGFARGSAGNVGVSDGWQDFNRNGAMTWTYPSAGPGNVALMGEAAAADGVLALAFSADPGGAHTLALESLAAGIDAARTACTADWEAWAATLASSPGAPGDPAGLPDALIRSAAVIKAHGDHSYPGAFVASLSTPWGDTRSDLSGYHLVWPRDATEAGFALLAVGHADDAAGLLEFLISTQQADGHWEQNFFPDGTTFWSGTQLDETALPVMLAAKLADEGHPLPAGSDTMVRDALEFLVSNGPLTQEDRWEEDPGGSPFTLGVMICALVAGAGFLARAGGTSPLSAPESAYVLALADNWNERIESWTYATGSDLDAKYNIPGHYVRIGAAPNGDPNATWGPRGFIPIKNQPGGEIQQPAALVVGMEFLYLARLGLRAATDQRLVDTITVVEGEIGQTVPTGRAYHRYNDDGYGEANDGSPFTGSGIGRLWPLLAGERGHFEALAGRPVTDQLTALVQMAGPGGLIPEQVWEAADIPAFGLTQGHPTGSAMPLVWAHAELVKLAATRSTGSPTELLAAVLTRYKKVAPTVTTAWYWRDAIDLDTPDGGGFDVVPTGRELVVEDSQQFTLHWGHDNWQNVADLNASPTAFGRYGATLTAAQLAGHSTVEFTRRYAGGWEGKNHTIEIVAAAPSHLRSVRVAMLAHLATSTH
jgi:glucoamylase